jgi:hypothetical protein
LIPFQQFNEYAGDLLIEGVNLFVLGLSVPQNYVSEKPTIRINKNLTIDSFEKFHSIRKESMQEK